MKTSPNIICVIVTFNRLPYLRQLLQAVFHQTVAPDRIVIVDNHSTDGARLWLSETAQTRSDIFPVFQDRNIGGAGGFHCGVKAAYELGAEWIWTMDDDCLPDPQALENLVRQIRRSEEHTGFLASQVLWKDGSPHEMNTPEEIRITPNQNFRASPISYSSFVSVLINRKAIEKVGFPIKEFFIYSDDVEFTKRITRAGFSAYIVPSSQVIHLTEENRGITMDRIVANPPEIGFREYALRNLIAVNKLRPFGVIRETARLIYVWMRLMMNRTPVKSQVRLLTAGASGLILKHQKWIEFPKPSDRLQ